MVDQRPCALEKGGILIGWTGFPVTISTSKTSFTASKARVCPLYPKPVVQPWRHSAVAVVACWTLVKVVMDARK